MTVTVVNLDATANLNVRRTPETTSEVLAQLPLGTTAQFVGLDENGEWVFLSYSASDGTTVTGWSSIDFLDFSYNGRAIDLAELAQRGLMNTVDLSRRGEKTIGAPPVIAATVDPTIDAVVATVALDPGANLNLRRSPDVNAEVLAQIPSGTRVIVTERTADGQWLHATYEGADGWIAARTDTAVFVTLSFNGAPYEINDVPVAAEGS